jgi:uncharacterized coiled-coil DUF342 family protein
VSCNNATDPAERANRALQECRAELALLQLQKAAITRRVLELESIKPLLDGLALQQAESERDTAQAEIGGLQVSLEAARKEILTMVSLYDLTSYELAEAYEAVRVVRAERDTARADYERAVKLMRDKDAQWHRRQEGWRKSSDEHYAALQAKVARAVAELEDRNQCEAMAINRALEALR